MIDISIVARKAIPDPYAPLEFGDPGPPKLAGTALLSDKQVTMLGEFVLRHLPAHQRDKFRSSVLNRLSDGRPGDAALRQVMRLTAEKYGFTEEQLSSVGLIFARDRADPSKRAGVDRPRKRWRRGKHD